MLRIFCLIAVLCMPSTVWAENWKPSALDLFCELPLTIFENTPAGLREDEREQLVNNGRNAYWAIIRKDDDVLELTSLPYEDTQVSLHVFREKEKSVTVVIGTSTRPVCALEMWQMDTSGRLIPVETPPEPPITDFFAPGEHMPRDVQPSILFCASAEGLEVEPLFWTANGMAHVLTDNRVHYVWENGRFIKKVDPKNK